MVTTKQEYIKSGSVEFFEPAALREGEWKGVREKKREWERGRVQRTFVIFLIM
jgi:hypothetical protein